MAKKTLFGSFFSPVSSEQPAAIVKETETSADESVSKQSLHKIDACFRESLRRGETSGDFVVLDEQGKEILNARPRKSIFDF